MPLLSLWTPANIFNDQHFLSGHFHLRFAYFDTDGILKGSPLVRVSNSSAPWYMFDANVSVGAIVEALLVLPPPTLSVEHSGVVADPSFVVEMTDGA